MKFSSHVAKLSIFAMAFAITTATGFAESRSERKAREAAESAAPAKVEGATTFTVESPYADTFAAIVRTLQKADYTIETANKDAGTIITSLAITGGYRQTGTRAQITVIDEGNGKSTIKAVVSAQKRYNGLQTEAWSTAKRDDEQTKKLSAQLQDALRPAAK